VLPILSSSYMAGPVRNTGVVSDLTLLNEKTLAH
jgi:hypothetical protein